MSALKRAGAAASAAPSSSSSSRPGVTPRGGLGSLNVDLNSGGGGSGGDGFSARTPRSIAGSGGGGHGASSGSGGGNFNDELNRLLHADQAAVAASSSSSSFASGASGGARKALPGRRAASSSIQSPSTTAAAPASPSHAGMAALSLRTGSVTGSGGSSSSAATASSGSGSGSLTSRGPRPRQSTTTGGAYTSRLTAKDAAASAAAAAASAAAAAASAASAASQRGAQVSDSDSDEERSGPTHGPVAMSRRSTVNTVSSNAAAALYANNNYNNNYNSNSNSINGPSASTPTNAASPAGFPSSSPGLNKLASISLQAPPLSSSSSTNATPASPAAPSSTATISTSLYSAGSTPGGGGGGGGGGGVPGERDPNLKWAQVDSFALATPKQKTGSVLVLAAHLTRSAATPHVVDKCRAIFRWICECIQWVPGPSASATAATSGAGAARSSNSTNQRAPSPPASSSSSTSAAASRPRGVSEASAAAKEAAKAAAESKMEAEAKLGRGGLPRLGLGLPQLDDDDSDDDDDGEGGGGGSGNGGAGGRGRNSSRPAIDVLTDIPEILRRRRASAEGLAKLFQALAESAGMECVVVQGYGKGCGLVKVAERFDPVEGPWHWWNAVRLSEGGSGASSALGGASQSQGQWALVDVAWSSGYINQGRFERVFANAYFKPNATIFALQHFPTKCIVSAPPPGAASTTKKPSKTVAEFIKNPERMQFLDFGGGSNNAAKSPPPQQRYISKSQFEDAMMIERGYLDLGVLMLHPLGVHTVRHDTPMYTVSLQAPSTLEFVVTLHSPKAPSSSSSSVAATPGAPPPPPRFVDQCWHISYTPMQDDPGTSRVDILLCFPFKGTYTATIRARRLASKLLQYDDVIHYRFLASCGLFDIRKERDVFAGFLAKRITVGSDFEFEHKFAILRPLKGHFELNQPTRLQIVAPSQVTRMVAVNNGRWVELQSTQATGSANSGNVVGSNSSNGTNANGGGGNFNPLRGKQFFEGELKLQRFPDIQIHYKTKGQQFYCLYKFGVVDGNAEGGSGTSASNAVTTTGEDGSTLASAAALASESKHGKIVLDSRGTCFEKRLHITALKIGKRSAQILFDTKAGTQVKAEVRAGWTSAIKVNDKITVTQTGSRAAAESGSGGGGSGGGDSLTNGSAANGAPQYDQVSWDVTTQLAEPGDYSVHLFLSSAGSGVFRFALVLYLRIGDKASGFNLDV